MTRGRRAVEGQRHQAPNGYWSTFHNGKWIGTGRLVAGQARGRPLESNERVRYKDGNQNNNTPDNLEVFTVKQKSNASRRAALQAKIEELQHELEELGDD